MEEPVSLRFGTELPRIKELAAGASWRRDERRHRAGDLVVTYQIRQRIAEEQGVESVAPREKSAALNNLKSLVRNLGTDPDRIVSAFVLSGSQSLLYWMFEAEDDGT